MDFARALIERFIKEIVDRDVYQVGDDADEIPGAIG